MGVDFNCYLDYSSLERKYPKDTGLTMGNRYSRV